MTKKELTILGLTTDRTSRQDSDHESYLLLLLEKESGLRLPVIIGTNEAQAIIIATTDIQPPRPFTHDSFYNVMVCFGIELKEVYIYQVKNDIFYAEMLCEQNGQKHRFDTRASDAIAMALRFNVPIYTNDKVLETAGIAPFRTEENTKREESPSEIKTALEIAIKNEDYETAAILRDKLNNLKSRNKPN